MNDNFIMYTLPKSRTTQMLIGGKKIEKLWEGIIYFLKNCTDANYRNPKRIEITCWDNMFEGEDNEFAKLNVENTRKIFGEWKNSIPRFHNGIKIRESQFNWQIKNEEMDKALSYIIEGQPWPKFFMGPSELLLTYHFNLIDPETKIKLPNQSINSMILFWLSRSSNCSPLIYFPFETNSLEFYEYLEKIKPFLPFKLEHKYLRIGIKNKKGNYYFRKVIL